MRMCIAARLSYARKKSRHDSTLLLRPIRNGAPGLSFVRRTFFSRHAELCYDPSASILDRLLYPSESKAPCCVWRLTIKKE